MHVKDCTLTCTVIWIRDKIALSNHTPIWQKNIERDLGLNCTMIKGEYIEFKKEIWRNDKGEMYNVSS